MLHTSNIHYSENCLTCKEVMAFKIQWPVWILETCIAFHFSTEHTKQSEHTGHPVSWLICIVYSCYLSTKCNPCHRWVRALPSMSISSSDVWQVFNFILNPLASFLSPDAILNADTTSGRNAELAQTQQTIQLSTKLPPHFLSIYM